LAANGILLKTTVYVLDFAVDSDTTILTTVGGAPTGAGVIERLVVVWPSMFTVSPSTRGCAVMVKLVTLLGSSTLYSVVVLEKAGCSVPESTVRLPSSTSGFTVAESEQP
jgi:hypothetical protein